MCLEFTNHLLLKIKLCKRKSGLNIQPAFLFCIVFGFAQKIDFCGSPHFSSGAETLIVTPLLRAGFRIF